MLLEAAHAVDADPRTAVALLERALGLWRGPDVADVGDEPAVRAEIQQLEWLRLSAIEDLARLRLALGEHEQAVPELRRALAEAPYNEQLWASLMIAARRAPANGPRPSWRTSEPKVALRAELDIEPDESCRTSRRRMREGEPMDAADEHAAPTLRASLVLSAPAEPTIQAC